MSMLWCTVVGCNVEEDRSTASHSLKAAADAPKPDTPDASHGAVLAHDTRHEGHKVVQLRAQGASPCMLWRGSVVWRVIGRGGGTVVATPLWLGAYLVHIIFGADAKVDGNSEINGATSEKVANQANVLHNSGTE